VQNQVAQKCRNIYSKVYLSDLRRRCLRDRMCKLAQDKYERAILEEPCMWQNYLRSASGRERVSKWVDRKLADVASKWHKMDVR